MLHHAGAIRGRCVFRSSNSRSPLPLLRKRMLIGSRLPLYAPAKPFPVASPPLLDTLQLRLNQHSRWYSNWGKDAADTIFALSSGRGRAGVAVIRLSGPKSRTVLDSITSSDGRVQVTKAARATKIEPRRVYLRRLYHPFSREHLDTGLAVYFKGPHSFTGEDMLELHVHGGTAVMSAVMTALGSINGVRTAEAGEFTRRAFVAGKLDMTEAEGINDLVHADTNAQRAQALQQMEGRQAKLLEEWRTELLQCLAHVEAVIDFSEDEPVGQDVAEAVVPRVRRLRHALLSCLRDGRVGERLRQGASLALAGPPNAGKSSLLNALTRRDAAIVSPQAGTTRDVVEVPMDVGGYPVQLCDTAGLRGARVTTLAGSSDITSIPRRAKSGEIVHGRIDAVEEEGITRALSSLRQADLKVIVLDGVEVLDCMGEGEGTIPRRTELDGVISAALQPDSTGVAVEDSRRAPVIVVLNKMDLLSPYDQKRAVALLWKSLKQHSDDRADEGALTISPVSCKTEEGISSLRGVIQSSIANVFSSGSMPEGGPIVTRSRHREQLQKCAQALDNYLAFSCEVDLAAEELREALHCIGRLSGHVDVEDVLDVIFRDFCIGK